MSTDEQPQVFVARNVPVMVDVDLDEADLEIQVLVYQYPDGTTTVALRHHDSPRDRWGPPVVAVEELPDGRRMVTGSEEHRVALSTRSTAPDEGSGERLSVRLARFGGCVACAEGQHGMTTPDGRCSCCRWPA